MTKFEWPLWKCIITDALYIQYIFANSSIQIKSKYLLYVKCVISLRHKTDMTKVYKQSDNKL